MSFRPREAQRVLVSLIPSFLLSSTVLAAGTHNSGVIDLSLHNALTATTQVDTASLTEKTVPLPSSPTTTKKIAPNELGRIPILMYHQIGGKMPRVDHGLVRSVAQFQNDLEMLYKAGFRPVNMTEIVTDHIDIPAGMSPVALTFDDGRSSQFRYIRSHGTLTMDPNCAVAILEAFHKKHPDWPNKATFFILPKSPYTSDAFGQIGLGNNKIKYLFDRGFEIGNHTYSHHSMGPMNPTQIQAEVGHCDQLLQAAAPQAKINVLALPMGVYPRNKSYWPYLVSGTYKGKPYRYDGAMLAAYRPIPSPSSKAFNRLRMERISAMDHDPNGSTEWIKRLLGSERKNLYISDGDPTTISFPKTKVAQVNTAHMKALGLTPLPYAPPPSPKKAKTIKTIKTVTTIKKGK